MKRYRTGKTIRDIYDHETAHAEERRHKLIALFDRNGSGLDGRLDQRILCLTVRSFIHDPPFVIFRWSEFNVGRGDTYGYRVDSVCFETLVGQDHGIRDLKHLIFQFAAEDRDQSTGHGDHPDDEDDQ